jgi:SAM-dependent methyltransferase
MKVFRREPLLLIVLIAGTYILYSWKLQKNEGDFTEAFGSEITCPPFTSCGQFFCPKKSAKEVEELKKEASFYHKDLRFKKKIDEAKGDAKPDARQPAILKYLGESVFQRGNSILDLGCAAGSMLRLFRDFLDSQKGGHGRLVGVELTKQWVDAAKQIFKGDIDFFHEDVTEVRGPTGTYDVITLNDVMEHIQTRRYGCLFQTLKHYTHPGSVVYMHIPSPATQLEDNGQFFENVVPYDVLISGMACYGFELRDFSYDLDTNCGSDLNGFGKTPARCVMANLPKYSHVVFRRVQNEKVFRTSS